jgi:hypothetical protein
VSKRFGRNQRRKLREQIQTEAERVQFMQGQQMMLSDRIRGLEGRLTNWARAINSQLGPEHPMNERIYEMVVERLPYANEIRRFAETPRFSSQEAMSRTLEDASVALTYVEAVTHLVELEPARFGFSVRALLHSRDGSTAYMIDRQVLRDGRRDPRFVQWLANELAEKLSRQLADAA